jgi:hypothetical protein
VSFFKLNIISVREVYDSWSQIVLSLEPMGEPATKEYYVTVGSVTRLLRGTQYRLEPSKKNGRPRLLVITEDMTEIRELEQDIERNRKKIEEMDELMNILMKFFNYAPMHMGSLYIQDDDLYVKLINPANKNWYVRFNPQAKQLLEEGKPVTASKFPKIY